MRAGVLVAACVWLGLPFATLGAPASTPELVAVLESDASLEEKAIACRELGEIGTPEAVPALARLLDHEVLGAYARTGLERIPDPSAAAALRSALEATRGERLVGVITSLGALRDEQAVGRLSELAAHDDVPVSRAALLALGRLASPEAVRTVRAALAAGREGAAAACLLAAEQQLAGGGADAAIALYDAVRSGDVARGPRLGATRGAIVARGSVAFLMEQLESEDASVRDVALLAIREMPSASLADALHARVASAPPDLRPPLITALADCHNDDSLRLVRSQLGSEARAVRLAALAVVSVVGRGPDLAATLLEVIEGRRSAEERQTAAGLLTRMEGGRDVDDVILGGLREAEAADVRIDLMRVLGDRQVRGAIPDLLEQARDEDPGIRAAAVRSMRRLAGPSEVRPLIAVIESEENRSVRTAAISTLVSACGDDGASGEQVLAKLNQTSDASATDAWIRVLTAVGYPKALPTILENLDRGDRETVATTITHLGRWPDPTPVEALLPFVEDGADAEVRRRAVSALIRLTTNAADRGQRPDDVLVGWFGRADAAVETVEEKRQLLSGLGRVHTVGSLRLLEPYLRDPEVEVEALHALLAIGSPLVKAGQSAAVLKALPDDATIEDPELRWRLGGLREQAAASQSLP